MSTPPGYACHLPEEAVDAWRFERALTRARGLLAADPGRARTQTAAALRLWRGEAYAEFAGAPWAAAEAARLTGLRLTARETHVAATLRLGRPAEAVAEAEALTREEPLREEGRRLLVLALWPDGRQADALAALRRVRRSLREDLGIGPGPELTALEEAILNRRWDALRDKARGGPPPAGAPAAGTEGPEPPGPGPAVGRAGSLRGADSASVGARWPGTSQVEGVRPGGRETAVGPELPASGPAVGPSPSSPPLCGARPRGPGGRRAERRQGADSRRRREVRPAGGAPGHPPGPAPPARVRRRSPVSAAPPRRGASPPAVLPRRPAGSAAASSPGTR
ncbi:BTAD domain-containing putative transcriptional regulator [Streptomyces sp. B8F3]|uniref:AfsR/SARP family transcriptional regulator n=1 Tax=unclassified Streptomyces TaxID=2593676 RepID=UPI00325F91FF